MTPINFKVGQRLTHKCPRIKASTPAEFRGFHNHAETGQKVARCIFRPQYGPPFEASVDPAELLVNPYTVIDWTQPGSQDQSASLERAQERLWELMEGRPEGDWEITDQLAWGETMSAACDFLRPV